ncbi:hypothetical protein GGR52DRAFT_591242 [Hypoxylon sp. FL1284]|nr:hypothetical protein GGR52DRAFT_591242 [Hypoxylon sp. FL1284]
MGTRAGTDASTESPDNRQYTTVGSVWQPQSLPMQPPERRARTLKSFMSQPYDENLSSFTNNPYAASSDQYSSEYFAHHHPIQQQHQHPHYVPEYSPLQQNFDRAVSPLRLSSPLDLQHSQTYDPDLQQFDTLDEYRYAIANMSGQQRRIAPVIPVTPLRPIPAGKKGDKDKDKREDTKSADVAASKDGSDDEKSRERDEDMEYALNHMPTKTLVSLASYKNPMQKTAQKILTKAREVVPASDLQAAGPNPPPGFAGSSGSRVGTPNTLSNPENMTYKSSNYPGILARGPGAPLPLTAGPPGQRQFRPAGFDKDLQKNADKSREALSSESQQKRVMYGASQQAKPPYNPEGLPVANRWGAKTIPWGMNMGRPTSEKMSDTVAAGQVLQFFPQGLPADFDYKAKNIHSDWQERRTREVEQEEMKPQSSVLLQQTSGWKADHKDRLERDFYGGNNKINKSMNMAVHEHKSRAMVRAIGSEMKENRMGEGKVVNRKISIEEADAIPVHRHAQPLLSMAYQTLADRPGEPKPQRKPDNIQ